MDLFSIILGLEPLIRNYPAIFSLFTSLFLGEEIILILSFLSANGYLSIWIVFVFCFIGRITSDFFFFTLGKLKIANKLVRYQKNFIYEGVENLFSKLNRKNTFITLLYTKFFIGIRAAMMFYMGYRGISLKRAVVSDIFAVFVWMMVLVPIGWFAGSSFKLVLNTFDDIKIAIIFLVGIILLFLIGRGYIRKKIHEKKISI